MVQNPPNKIPIIPTNSPVDDAIVHDGTNVAVEEESSSDVGLLLGAGVVVTVPPAAPAAKVGSYSQSATRVSVGRE